MMIYELVANATCEHTRPDIGIGVYDGWGHQAMHGGIIGRNREKDNNICIQ